MKPPIARVAFVVAVAAPVHTQAQAVDAVVVEQRIDDRWLVVPTQARVAPFRETRSFSVLTPTQPTVPGHRAFAVSIDRFTGATDMRLQVTARGRIALAAAAPRGATITARANFNPTLSADDSLAVQVGRYFEGSSSLRLPSAESRTFLMPQARLWDLLPTLPDTPLAPGATWVDTVSLAANDGRCWQLLDGRRVTHVVGDTNIDGRRLWIVRDSMSVTLREQFIEVDRSFGTWVTLGRRVSGQIRGRAVIDPERGISLWRTDTTALTGVLAVVTPNGASNAVPVRFDRYRTLTSLSPPQYRTRVANLRTSPELTIDGVGPRITPPILTRLSADTVLADSLLRAWDRAPNVREAAAIWTELSAARPQGQTSAALTFRTREMGVRLAALRDSTALLQRLVRDATTWTLPIVRDILLPLAEDGARSYAHGVAPDVFYASAVNALVAAPPALSMTDPRPLAPEIVTLFAGELAGKSDPRLRDLSLLARYVRDPARWADTVRAHAGTATPVLQPAVLLARGVGAVWPRTGQVPMPAVGEDWHAWQRWVGERPAASLAPAIPPLVDPSMPVTPGQPQATLFGPTHVRAIRMQRVQTGRDVSSELRAALAATTSDSARTLYTTILRDVGGLVIADGDLIADLRSGIPDRITNVRTIVQRRVAAPPRGGAAAPAERMEIADSATGVALLDRTLGVVTGRAEPWRTVEQAFAGSSTPARIMRPTANAVVLSDSMPAAVAARWATITTVMTQADWTRRDPSDRRSTLAPAAVRQSGPFAYVAIRLQNGSLSFTLVRIDGEWLVLSTTAMVS